MNVDVSRDSLSVGTAPIWPISTVVATPGPDAGPRTFVLGNARLPLPETADRPLHAELPRPYRSRTMTYRVIRDPGRRCAAPGCLTVLSVYNSDYLCFAHADVRTRAPFERRAASIGIDHPSISPDSHMVRLFEPAGGRPGRASVT
jgi:hypothetical protein